MLNKEWAVDCTQMNRIEGLGPLPYMGITGTHTIMNRMS